MVTETDISLDAGRVLHVYDAGPDAAVDSLAVIWHHGTPNVGEPPEPLFAAAERLRLRWVSYDRPGYGGSTPRIGRDVASAAADVAAIADALGLERFAVMGHSGGSPHALACAALLPDRVVGAVCAAVIAPFAADGLDWFHGMAPAGAAELRAAAAGRSDLEALLSTSDFDPEQFTPADHAALAGPWSWLGGVAGKALEAGLGGMLDDDVAYVAPWGVDLGQVRAPVLILHGEEDRIAPPAHAKWLAARIPSSELWLRPEDGHVSILREAEAALAWLKERVSDP